MKDGRFETQEEIFKTLLEGKKITYYQWENRFAHMKDKNVYYSDGHAFVGSFSDPSQWLIYEEHKKKVNLLRVLAKDNDCKVYLIPEYLFDSIDQAKRYFKENNRFLHFIKVIEEIEVEED